MMKERTAFEIVKPMCPKQRVVEIVDALLPIRITGRGHLAQHERMATHRALPEDDEVAGEKIRAFDRDGTGTTS